MNKKDVQKFLDLRSKLWDEFHALEAVIDELDEKREELVKQHGDLTNILNGYTTDLPDEEPEEAPASASEVSVRHEAERAVLHILKASPGLGRSALSSALGNFTLSEIDAALQRLRKRSEVISEGRGRAAVWYVTE